MAAAVRSSSTRQHLALKLLTLLLFFVLMKGLLPKNSYEEFQTVNLHLGKEIVAPRIPASTLSIQPRTSSHHNETLSARVKAVRALKILQYYCIASLTILISGDVSSNPGWCDPRLQKPGLKIAQLNIRSLPKHIEELKILTTGKPV